MLLTISGKKVQMAGSEQLIQEANPHITKLAIEARMKDKDGPKNKQKKQQVSNHMQLKQQVAAMPQPKLLLMK